MIIDDFTVGSVEHAVREVQAMDDASVSRQISDLQSMALENYTLER